MPRVSIGLPVWNGERYLRGALESLLAQTFRDFEIVVCDNASTDGTRRIAEEIVKRDRRVRYVRSSTNLGAAANFNRAFDLSRGELFKWAAHDDLCAPRFLERCVAALDADPSAVLAHPATDIIDENGDLVAHYDLRLSTDSGDPVERFEAMLGGHSCYQVFGLARRAALRRTGLIGSYAHGDGVLLARLALQGRFVEVGEPLFMARRHPQQSMSRFANDYRRWAEWFDPRLGGSLLFPWWRIHLELLRSVRSARLPARTRWRCYGRLLRWANYRRDKLSRELGSNLVGAVTRVISGISRSRWRPTTGPRPQKVGRDSLAT